MATLINTIKKAEKLSGQKVRVNGQTHSVTYKGETVQFMANGRIEAGTIAVCFYTFKHARTEDDMNSDYFPGTFHDNLSQAFRFLDSYYANK